MAKLIFGTTYVGMDEPCFCLYETDQLTPNSKEKHRYQVMKLVRNDRLTEFRRDLGHSKNFKAEQFFLMGGWQDDLTGKIAIEETVGRMLEMAEYMRTRVTAWTVPSQNLLDGYYKMKDKEKTKNRILIGRN
jgi:hypothetical protein